MTLIATSLIFDAFANSRRAEWLAGKACGEDVQLLRRTQATKQLHVQFHRIVEDVRVREVLEVVHQDGLHLGIDLACEDLLQTHASICLSVHLNLPFAPSIRLSADSSICPSLRLSVHLSMVHLSVRPLGGWTDAWMDGRMDGWIDGRTDGWTSSLSGIAILAGSRQSQFLQRLPSCVESRADAGHLEDFHLITQSSLGPTFLCRA